MSEQSPLPPTGKKNLEAFQALLEVDQKERSFQSRMQYQTAYLLSLLLPPLGAYYWVKFMFFSNATPDDIRAAWVSLGLTVLSLLFSLWFFGLLFSPATVEKTTNNMDTIKQLVTPANMQDFKDLLQ